MRCKIATLTMICIVLSTGCERRVQLSTRYTLIASMDPVPCICDADSMVVVPRHNESVTLGIGRLSMQGDVVVGTVVDYELSGRGSSVAYYFVLDAVNGTVAAANTDEAFRELLAQSGITAMPTLVDVNDFRQSVPR